MLEEIEDHYDGRTAVKSRTYELQAGGVYKASKIRRTRAQADQSPRRGVDACMGLSWGLFVSGTEGIVYAAAKAINSSVLLSSA